MTEPVWMPSVASAWLLWSPFIERIRHRSSAHSATCGNSSLISMPDSAARLELPTAAA